MMKRQSRRCSPSDNKATGRKQLSKSCRRKLRCQGFFWIVDFNSFLASSVVALWCVVFLFQVHCLDLFGIWSCSVSNELELLSLRTLRQSDAEPSRNLLCISADIWKKYRVEVEWLAELSPLQPLHQASANGTLPETFSSWSLCHLFWRTKNIAIYSTIEPWTKTKKRTTRVHTRHALGPVLTCETFLVELWYSAYL